MKAKLRIGGGDDERKEGRSVGVMMPECQFGRNVFEQEDSSKVGSAHIPKGTHRMLSLSLPGL